MSPLECSLIPLSPDEYGVCAKYTLVSVKYSMNEISANSEPLSQVKLLKDFEKLLTMTERASRNGL